MIGLFLIGICLILGVGRKIAGYSGALMLLLMWFAILPIKNNPFLDEHIIYALILIFLAYTKTKFSLVKQWSKIRFVKKYNFLE
jgi:thiosulfate dehydrogenase [quinone] large subunit